MMKIETREAWIKRRNAAAEASLMVSEAQPGVVLMSGWPTDWDNGMPSLDGIWAAWKDGRVTFAPRPRPAGFTAYLRDDQGRRADQMVHELLSAIRRGTP